MGRGGTRVGGTGKPHAQRTDLDDPGRSTGYGTRAARERMLDAVPLKPAARPSVAPRQYVEPTPPLPLDRPSERPNEPLTAGLAFGAGPGPEALASGPTPVDYLRDLYAAYPYEDLREILEELDD